MEIALMRTFGWTYDQLMQTPADVITAACILLDAEGKAAKERMARNG